MALSLGPSVRNPLSDAESFDIDANGRITDIGRKAGDVAKIKGQYMGLLKVSPSGWRRISDYVERMAPSERDRLDMTSLLQRLIAEGTDVMAVSVAGPWGEVDSASDLAVYEQDIQAGRLVP